MPQFVVDSFSHELIQLFMHQDIVDSSFGVWNFLLGGAINEIGVDSTSVHPSMRSSVFSMSTRGSTASDIVREFVPNQYSGVDYNHHYVLEPEWRSACWGSNYARLLELKRQYDFDKVLNCWHW